MSQGDFYGGGGYMNTGSPFSTNNSPSGQRRNDVGYSLRPLTLAQVQKATQAHADAEWKVEDMDVGQITVVAQVVNVTSHSTNLILTLEDGTGRSEARHWIVDANGEDNRRWNDIQPNTYVRIVGGLKSFGKKRYINAMQVRQVTDPHEVYYHILEAITVTLTLERGPPTTGQQSSSAAAPTGSTDTAAAYVQPTSSRAKNQFNNLPPLQRAIVMFILDQPQSDIGVDVGTIAKAMSANAGDAHKIGDALEKLMDEGHVYTTIDESHFNVSL